MPASDLSRVVHVCGLPDSATDADVNEFPNDGNCGERSGRVHLGLPVTLGR